MSEIAVGFMVSLMGIFDFLKNLFRGKKEIPSQKFKCPNCHFYPITLEIGKCPECGVDVKSMFRIKCPHCEAPNEVGAEKCWKCEYEFKPEEEENISYSCSVCGYETKKFFIVCPVCGTRIV